MNTSMKEYLQFVPREISQSINNRNAEALLGYYISLSIIGNSNVVKVSNSKIEEALEWDRKQVSRANSKLIENNLISRKPSETVGEPSEVTLLFKEMPENRNSQPSAIEVPIVAKVDLNDEAIALMKEMKEMIEGLRANDRILNEKIKKMYLEVENLKEENNKLKQENKFIKEEIESINDSSNRNTFKPVIESVEVRNSSSVETDSIGCSSNQASEIPTISEGNIPQITQSDCKITFNAEGEKLYDGKTKEEVDIERQVWAINFERKLKGKEPLPVEVIIADLMGETNDGTPTTQENTPTSAGNTPTINEYPSDDSLPTSKEEKPTEAQEIDETTCLIEQLLFD